MDENWEEGAIYDYRVTAADETQNAIHEILSHEEMLKKQPQLACFFMHPHFVEISYVIDLVHLSIKRLTGIS